MMAADFARRAADFARGVNVRMRRDLLARGQRRANRRRSAAVPAPVSGDSIG